MIHRKEANIRLLHKFARASWQAVAALARQGAHIAAARMSPSLAKDGAELCLTKMREVCLGPTIIAGDTNANHSSWSSAANARGALLRS